VITPTEDRGDFGAHGSITIFHSPTNRTEHVTKHGNVCTFSFTERGTYVFGNGTGEWANYSGSGRYVTRGSGTGSCRGGPATGTVIVRANGPISPINTDN
jgi:hypothetical protein